MRLHGPVAAAQLAAALLIGVAAVAAPTPENSLYLLDVDLVTQTGEPAAVDLYRGRPVLLTMFYASCTHVCPLIIDTIQWMERDLSAEQRERLRVLMVSIDADRDSPQSLHALAERHGVDVARWTLARAPSADVRRLAAVLGVRYRALPDGEFNHSTVIALLDEQGRIVNTTTVVGRPDEAFMRKLRDVLDGGSGRVADEDSQSK
jgi:protein SCO1/2